MKKIYCFIAICIATLATLPAMGRQLSPSEALNRVSASTDGPAKVKAKVNAIPALTVASSFDSSFAGVYVFSTPRQPGFLILSADDCALPVLGYSDTEEFDADNIPSQLQWWLQSYADQIKYASANGLTTSSSPSKLAGSAIAPMLKSKWNQEAPYNAMCPKLGGEPCPTGCVATAMAQLMYYYKFPAKGTGSNSYEWNNRTLSMDFNTVTFDWNAMTPTYDANSTQGAKDAVANLMYALGISVNMNYNTYGSGASSLRIGSALYDYFGYDKSMYNADRLYFTQSEWENLVYGELAAGRPVIYGGASDSGGHEFVCDGYQGNGYFHFNWGWGGMSDGYFLLSALNPYSQGTGGSDDGSGYNFSQTILVNAMPAKTGTKIVPTIISDGNFAIGNAQGAVSNSFTANLGDGITGFAVDAFDDSEGCGMYNVSALPLNGQYGMKFTPVNGGAASYVRDTNIVTIAPSWGYNGLFVRIPTNLAAGKYIVTPAFYCSDINDWVDILCPVASASEVNLQVLGSRATITQASFPSVKVSGVSFPNTIYSNAKFRANLTFANNSKEQFYTDYFFVFFDSKGQAVAQTPEFRAVNIDPGQTVSTEFIGTLAGNGTIPEGDYSYGVYTYPTYNQIYKSTSTIHISRAPANSEIKISNFEFENVTSTGDAYLVHFKGDIECTQGFFSNTLMVGMLPAEETYVTNSATSNFIFLSQGESTTFTATGSLPFSENGKKYKAAVFYWKNNTEYTQLTSAITFDISGINSVSDDSEVSISRRGSEIAVSSSRGLSNVKVFALDGRTLLNLDADGESVCFPADNISGPFIIVVTDSDGHVTTRRII